MRAVNFGVDNAGSVCSKAASKKISLGDKRALPIIAVCIGQIFWGFSFMFSKIAMGYASPEILLSMRFIIACLLMNIMRFSGKYKFSIKGKSIKPLILLAIMEPLYFYLESYGIMYANATLAGVILAIVPVVSIAVAALILKEYPSKKVILFCFLPIVGVIIITISGSALGVVRPIGVFLLLCTCFASAFYRTINKKAAEEYTAFERTYIVLMVSCTIFTFSAFRSVNWSIAEYIKPIFNIQFTASILALSVFCSIGANMLVNFAAGKMSVTKLSTFGSIQTLCSMFGGVLFLGEPITAMSFVGSILILVGIWKVTKAEN